jgi:hypothetical protein
MKLKIHLLFVLAFFQLILSPARSLALEVPAEWKFKTISTPHFDIIYNAEQQELGEYYARQMEKAYALTSTVFTVRPEKTLVIINDKTDSTNGYATRIPYPHIMTYPVLPGPQESLSESGDWSLELLAHEYTHILTFEPATGVFKTLRGIFGSIASPNLLLPNWWKEGLAVQIESSITPNGGRAKSLYQDAVIRAMTDDKTIFDVSVAQANEYIPTWPEGSRPYLFGSLFWSQSVSDYGNEVMNELNLRHSSRMPYAINTPAEEVLHDSYKEAYNKAIQDTSERAEKQIKILKEVPLTELHPLPIQVKYSSAPAISDDGKYMALLTVDYKADRVLDIYVRDPETNLILKKLKVEIKKEDEPVVPNKSNIEDGPPSGSIQKIAWFHKSPKLVYDRIHYVNRIERYADLNIYDVTTGKTKELTKSLRAREPSVSPNDDKIAFVKLEGGKTHLGLYDLATDRAKIVYSPALQARISYPVFLDQDTLLFALRSPLGEEGLKVLSLKDNTLTSLFPGYQQARFPVMTKRGLMFTAANNGVHNLYLASADLKTARPISHTLSMISMSAMDPDTENIYATTMTSVGPIVKRIEKADWEKTPASLPKIDRLLGDRYEDLIQPAPETEPPAKFETSDYEPGHYLMPRYWIPFLWSSPEGGVEIQVLTSGFDPLKKHMYDVMAAWNTYLNAADWAVGYLNNVTSLPVQFAASELHSYLVTRDNLVDDQLVSLSVLPDMWWLSDNVGTQVGWRYLQRTVTANPATKRTGPYLSLVYKKITQGGEQFTPQEGGGAYLIGVNYIDGQDLMAHSQFQTGGVYYFSKFLPKLHAIMVRASVLYTPERISYIYGTQSDSMDYVGDDFGAKFLARGYSTGQFVGRNMYSGSLEYRFPIANIYRGPGTAPVFFRRIWGTVVADAIATDGRAYDFLTNKPEVVDAHQVFWGFGTEAHFETTLGYELPITLVLGIYQGSDKKYAPDPTTALAIQFAGF